MTNGDHSGMQVASVLHGPRDIRLEQRRIPWPEPNEVLVRVLAVGVCGSDVHYYEHGRIGDFVVDAPLILGHEVSGEIVEVGKAVSAARIGERISIEPQRTNPWNEHSRAGRYNLDPDVEFFATPPYDGAFCEYVTIPSELAFAIPPEMTVEEAALIEPLAVAVATIRHAHISIGERVAIAGAGPIGLLIASLARLAGAGEVVVSDPLPEARERALLYGATSAIDPAVEDFSEQHFQVFIDASGVPAAVRAGLGSLKPAGRALLVGMGADVLELPLALVQVRELEIRGVFRYSNAWPTALALAREIDLAGLITGRFELSQVAEALAAASRRDQVKVMVKINGRGGRL